MTLRPCAVAGDPRGDVLLQTVESLAEAHDGFAQLFDVAALLADSERLYGHMAASPGMTIYVFDRRTASPDDALFTLCGGDVVGQALAVHRLRHCAHGMFGRASSGQKAV